MLLGYILTGRPVRLMVLAGSAILAFGLVVACGGGKTADTGQKTEEPAPVADAGGEHGVGPAANMEWKDGPLDPAKAAKGQQVYDVKCAACHSLGDNRVVGPGWKGITSRRTPQWAVNMMTNTEEMLDKDPVAKKQIEECMVRMPNQSLTMDDAKDVWEYMRKNDGAK